MFHICFCSNATLVSIASLILAYSCNACRAMTLRCQNAKCKAKKKQSFDGDDALKAHALSMYWDIGTNECVQALPEVLRATAFEDIRKGIAKYGQPKAAAMVEGKLMVKEEQQCPGSPSPHRPAVLEKQQHTRTRSRSINSGRTSRKQERQGTHQRQHRQRNTRPSNSEILRSFSTEALVAEINSRSSSDVVRSFTTEALLLEIQRRCRR